MIILCISRCLHVTVHSPGSSYAASGASPVHIPASKTAPLLSATFTFDDHIRCMAAKQRLTKGRIKARQRKMHQIARLLGITLLPSLIELVLSYDWYVARVF